MRRFIPVFIALVLVGCVSAPKVGPEIFESAEQAIAAAERAGAEELAPVELRFAREKLEAARANYDGEEYDDAIWLVEQSEINSELAIEQSRAAQSRRKANELRRENEVLREELTANFGEDFE